MAAKTIQPNSHVTLDYEIRDESGDLVDDSEAEQGQPIRYVHGYGMLVPGLEATLAGLEEGEERIVTVPAEAAYGDYDEELVLEIARCELPEGSTVSEGDELVAKSPDGEELALRVVALRQDAVVLDANHPLAGRSLRYRVKVRDIRPATESEIARAAAELDEAYRYVHGPDGDARDLNRVRLTAIAD